MTRRLSLLLVMLTTCLGCGAKVKEQDKPGLAEGLPAEFPFEYIFVLLEAPVDVDESDGLLLTATFDSTTSDEQQNSQLYPLQYGIGSEYPVDGSMRARVSACQPTDAGLFESACRFSIEELELTVAPHPTVPHSFMDEAVFAIDGEAVGVVEQGPEGPGYFWYIESATFVSTTRTGASRSEYATGINGSLGTTIRIEAHLTQ